VWLCPPYLSTCKIRLESVYRGFSTNTWNITILWDFPLLPFVFLFYSCRRLQQQEAQLPQRNSASAAHMEGYTYAYGRIRNPQQTYVKRAVQSTKRTLRWIGHSRSFKVILIGTDRNLEWWVSEITSALITYYDDTPIWIPVGTNKDDLEWR